MARSLAAVFSARDAKERFDGDDLLLMAVSEFASRSPARCVRAARRAIWVQPMKAAAGSDRRAREPGPVTSGFVVA
jgi:hypothetical protein